jgi:hypothetical protein
MPADAGMRDGRTHWLARVGSPFPPQRSYLRYECTMKTFDSRTTPRATWIGLRVGIALIAAMLIGSVAAGLVYAAPPTDDGMPAFALRWFTQMQAGKIDRAQYSAAYGAQLTDDAVQAMSHHLNEYGASPLRAEIVQKRALDGQILYEVKMVYPRGDATSLLFGFNAEGKITGIAIMTLAGD